MFIRLIKLYRKRNNNASIRMRSLESGLEKPCHRRWFIIAKYARSRAKQFEAVGGERCLQLFIMSLFLILNDEGVTVSKMDYIIMNQGNLSVGVCRDKTQLIYGYILFCS